MTAKSLFICEDHKIVIDGIQSILSGHNPTVKIVSFGSGESLLVALHSSTPDLLILDVKLPDMNGLDVLKQIRSNNSDLPVLILTMHKDPYLFKQAKDLGSNGILLKDFGQIELLKAIETVLQGDFYQSPTVEIAEGEESVAKSIQLTDREKEVIRLSAEGKSAFEIADALYLSHHTVNTHRRNIYKKLRINNVKELVKFAYDEGLA